MVTLVLSRCQLAPLRRTNCVLWLFFIAAVSCPLPCRLSQNELNERRKALEAEELALDARYKKAAADLDADNKSARDDLAKARKALAREKGELASKARNLAAEAEAAARKVRPLRACTVAVGTGIDHGLSFLVWGRLTASPIIGKYRSARALLRSLLLKLQ